VGRGGVIMGLRINSICDMGGKYNAKFPELKFMKNQSKSEK
jgi:hypothetical protein